MDPLRLSALGGAALSAPNQALVIPKAQPGNVQGTTAPNVAQGLAQDLFLRTLQAMNPLTGADQATPGTDLAAGLAPSLLAALTAPSAAVAATAPADTTTAATTATATTAATTTTATASDLATPLSATPALAAPDLTAATPQTAGPDSASLDFALETALRFGAGVVAQAAPAVLAPELGAGLVRDAAAVPRQGNLQLNTGRSGAEVLAQPRPTAPQAVNAYRTAAVTEPPAGLDLLA